MTSIRGIMMRAVLVRQFGGIENMKVENVSIPPVGDKQVLMKVYASGINPVDTYIREGAFFTTPELPYIPGMDGAGVVEAVGNNVTLYKVMVKVITSGVNPVDTYIRSGLYGTLPDLPYIPGKDAAGLVHSIGSKVAKFKPGDRVFTQHPTQMGLLAEFACVDESCVYPLDEKLSFVEGAGIAIPYFTAYRALFQKTQAKKDERVLIHGASGAVGLAAVQIGKAHGLHIVGTAGTKEGMDLVSDIGADKVFNHRDPKYLDQLQKEEKFDIILEMLANVNLGNDLTLMKPKGRTAVIGSRGKVSIDPRNIMATEASVMGVALFVSSPEYPEIAEGVLDGISAGWVKPVVDKVYQLEEAGQAHHDVIHNKGTKGKLVVKIQEP